jgi:hypothetical protein
MCWDTFWAISGHPDRDQHRKRWSLFSAFNLLNEFFLHFWVKFLKQKWEKDALAAWYTNVQTYIVVSSPPATEETGAMGLEIESHWGIGRVVGSFFKKDIGKRYNGYLIFILFFLYAIQKRLKDKIIINIDQLFFSFILDFRIVGKKDSF